MTEGFTSTDSGWYPADDAQPAAPAAHAGSVEWDHKGHVVRARFVNGQTLQFRYDKQGSLYAFTYAGLAWSTTSGARWTAVDEDNTYIIEGSVEVSLDGSLHVRKQGVLRSIKLSGVISDQFDDGTVVDSPRSSARLLPEDLLAVTKPKNTDTLNRLTPFRPEDQPASSPDAAGAGTSQQETPASASPRRSLAQGTRIRTMKEAANRAAGTPAPGTDLVGWLKRTIAESRVAVSEKLQGKDAPGIAPQLDALAAAAYGQRRIDEARLLHERALSIRKKTLGEKHPDVGISLHGLATVYHDWGRFNEAEQYYLESIKLLDNGFRKAVFLHSIGAVDSAYVGDHLERLIGALHSLASMYHEYKQPHLCEQICQAAVEIAAKAGDQHKALVKPKLESMAAMWAHLDMAKQPPDVQLRISRRERRARFDRY